MSAPYLECSIYAASETGDQGLQHPDHQFNWVVASEESSKDGSFLFYKNFLNFNCLISCEVRCAIRFSHLLL